MTTADSLLSALSTSAGVAMPHDNDTRPDNGSAPTNPFANATTRPFEYTWSTEFAIILATINIISACCIIVGNCMVLLVIVRHRGMRTRTNLFLVNLAVADLFVGVFAMPFSIATLLKHEWIFGHRVCLFNGWMNSFCLITSIHTLMYISIHKYFSIARPLSNPLTLNYIIAMMAAAWIWAAICSTMNIMGLVVEYKPGTSQCGPKYPNDVPTYLIHGIIQVSDLLIPLIILVFCYTRIFSEIKKLSTRLRAHSSAEDVDIIKQEKGVAVTLLIVLATFVIMAMPYLAYANYTTIRRDKKHFSGYLNPVAYTFLYLSSMCNPIIYAFRSPAFREGYIELLCQTPNYVTAEDAQLLPRTNRLSSIISILRRGSAANTQSIVNKNGDVIITRGDRIVCIRKAGEWKHAGHGPVVAATDAGKEKLKLLNERVTELDEEEADANAEQEVDEAAEDEHSSTGSDEVFRLLRANTERESLGQSEVRRWKSSKGSPSLEDGIAKSGSKRSAAINSENRNSKNKNASFGLRRDKPSVVTSDGNASSRSHAKQQSQNGGGRSTKSREGRSDQTFTNKLSHEGSGRYSAKKGDDNSLKLSRNSSGAGSMDTVPKALSKSNELDSCHAREAGAGVQSDSSNDALKGRKLHRGFSRSSGDVSKRTALVRLPSMEFLDPPIQLFRPRSNTLSNERIFKSKARGRPRSKSPTRQHHAARSVSPYWRKVQFENFSDIS
ncbi:unnamed protein product [Lymnaea stagnalis]|uniref:G-protein coupled receptors family 1 profile domain-containing protein n=1 Tax=Lymnaea stagnalis TaxID=6523 RepID=A0AAV2HBZ4_LYMST